MRLGELGHFAAGDVAGDAGRNLGKRPGVLAEDEIAGGEPHGVVRPLARPGRIAALVGSVGVEQAGGQMAGGRLADVVRDPPFDIGRGDGAQPLAARLDDAGDGQGVPQALAQSLGDERSLLLEARVALAGQEFARGVDERPAPRPQRLAPGAHRRPAHQGARRDIGLIHETAVQAIARRFVRARVGVAAEEFVAAVAQGRGRGRGHGRGLQSRVSTRFASPSGEARASSPPGEGPFSPAPAKAPHPGEASRPRLDLSRGRGKVRGRATLFGPCSSANSRRSWAAEGRTVAPTPAPRSRR